MGNDGHLAANSVHDRFQGCFSLFYGVEDAFAGAAGDIEAGNAQFEVEVCEAGCPLPGDRALFIVTGIECRENAGKFLRDSHD